MTAALASAWPVSAAARGERLAFVSSEADGDVVVVDLEAEKVTNTLPVGKVPHAMAIGRGGEIFVNNLYVVSGDNALVKIDVASGEVSSRVAVGARSFFFAVRDGDHYPLTEY